MLPFLLLAVGFVRIQGNQDALSQPTIEPPPVKFPCPGYGIPTLKGEKGSPGLPGLNGQSGMKGDKGTPGVTGKPGMKGNKGDSGVMGAQGQKGMKGTQGIKGQKGDEGKCDAQCGRIKSLETKLKALESNYTEEIKKLKEQIVVLERNIHHALGSEENPAVSCKAILKRDRFATNGPYFIIASGYPGGKILAYCIMNEYNRYCPNGLTQVMKIDGSKGTFKFSSPLWSNNQTYNPDGGKTGCDFVETKLPTYWSTPFTKICIRMRMHGRWRITSRSLNVQANSLYDLIADGKFRKTALGRQSWKNLLQSSSLQSRCTREGFNVQGKPVKSAGARIGVIADDKPNCDDPDSYIGFGTKGDTCGMNPHTSCGNEAGCGADNGDQRIQAYGYIYVY